MEGCMDGWTDGRTHKRMDREAWKTGEWEEWMYGWTDKDEQIHLCLHRSQKTRNFHVISTNTPDLVI